LRFTISFLQDYQIVPEPIEFQVLDTGHGCPHVICLPENAEGQNEQGVLRIDRLQAVVAAFVDVDDEVTEAHRLRIPHLAPGTRADRRSTRM